MSTGHKTPPLSGGSAHKSVGDPAIFGVLTVSDRASAGTYDDLSGPAILQFFAEAVTSPWTAKYVVIPDEQPLIEATLKDLVRHRLPMGGLESKGITNDATFMLAHTVQFDPILKTQQWAGMIVHRWWYTCCEEGDLQCACVALSAADMYTSLATMRAVEPIPFLRLRPPFTPAVMQCRPTTRAAA